MIAEQDIPTPITTALMLENGRAIAQGKTRPPIWGTMRDLERQLADAREQRDRLAEAVELVLEDSELTNGHFWPDVVAKCRAALAAVKGDSK